MKITAITLAGAALALGLAATTPVMAQPHHHYRHPVVVHHTVRNVGEGWQRGYRVPGHYRVTNYYVNDWQAHRLHRPAPGYVWVRNDNRQYVLMGTDTGIIYEIVNALN